jgi:hypothetical protein
MTNNKHKVGRRLSARDRKIIGHVARHRLTTIAVLRRTVLAGLSRNAANKVVSRLCDAGLLLKHTLLYPVRYFVLGEVGTRSLGINSHRAISLGPQSLPTEYALLVYTNVGKQPRRRLTKQEVLDRCPWLPHTLAAAPHCSDEANATLELLRVDLGGPADHVARRCYADIAARLRVRDFMTFVRERRFRIVVLTATKEKVTAIRQALDRHEWPTGLMFHFTVVSDLLSLTASRHHA